MLEEISNHWSYVSDIVVADGFIISQGGKKNPKKPTRRWELFTQMKKWFSKWVTLKDLKNSNNVEHDEYSVADNIYHEPSFAWWVPFTLKNGIG